MLVLGDGTVGGKLGLNPIAAVEKHSGGAFRPTVGSIVGHNGSIVGHNGSIVGHKTIALYFLVLVSGVQGRDQRESRPSLCTCLGR